MDQVCTVAVYVEQRGHLSQYCSKTVDKGRHEPDSHTLYPHMTHAGLHAIPHLSNRQLLPQKCKLMTYTERLQETIKQRDWLLDQTITNSMMSTVGCRLTEKLKNMLVVKVDPTHCCHKKNIGEPYYPLEGNTQEHDSIAGKILDGLTMSLGQTQHE